MIIMSTLVSAAAHAVVNVAATPTLPDSPHLVSLLINYWA